MFAFVFNCLTAMEGAGALRLESGLGQAPWKSKAEIKMRQRWMDVRLYSQIGRIGGGLGGIN